MKNKATDLYWIKSGLLTVFQNLSGVFLAFGSFYLLVRMLSPHDFGAWTLFMSTTTVLEIVRGGLIQNTLIKFLSSTPEEDHPKIISSSFAISGILTIFCILINLSLASYLGTIWKTPELVPLFFLFNPAFIFSGLMTQFNCIEQANLKFTGVFISNLIRQGLFFSYVFSCYLFSIRIELINLVYVLMISYFISMLISYLYAKSYFKMSFKLYRAWIKKLFDYGKFAFGTSVSSILAGTIDQMMLGAFISPAASGAFNVAVRITNLIDIPTNAVATIVFPQSAKRMETEGKEAIKYLYEKSVGVLMAILVPAVVFLFIFSDFVVHFIAGSKYEDTIPLLHITLLYCLLIPYGRQVGTILDSIGKPKLTFMIVITVASLNIALNYFLITNIGIMGAAYSSLIAAIVGFYIAKAILTKELNINLYNTLVYAVKFYPEMYDKYLRRKVVS